MRRMSVQNEYNEDNNANSYDTAANDPRRSYSDNYGSNYGVQYSERPSNVSPFCL